MSVQVEIKEQDRDILEIGKFETGDIVRDAVNGNIYVLVKFDMSSKLVHVAVIGNSDGVCGIEADMVSVEARVEAIKYANIQITIEV